MRSNINNPVVSSLHNKEMGNPVGRKPSHSSWQKVALVAGAIIGYFFLSRCYSLFTGSSNSLRQDARKSPSSLQPVDTKEEPRLIGNQAQFFYNCFALLHYKNDSNRFFSEGHEQQIDPLIALVEIQANGGMARLRLELEPYYKTLLPLSKKDHWNQEDVNRANGLIRKGMEERHLRFLPSLNSSTDRPVYKKFVRNLEQAIRGPFPLTREDVESIHEKHFVRHGLVKNSAGDTDKLINEFVQALQQDGLVSSDRHCFIL